MDQAEWLTSTDPQRMLTLWRKNETVPGWGYSHRKLRLFACACVRQAWSQLTDERSRRAVEVAEMYADGLVTEAELDATREGASAGWLDNLIDDSIAFHEAYRVCDVDAEIAARFMVDEPPPVGRTPADEAHLLREIIGNPFRPVRVKVHPGIGISDISIHDWESWLAWQDGTIPALAQAAYEERVVKTCELCKGLGYSFTDDLRGRRKYQCLDCHGTGRLATGELDAGRLQVLADALEESGCQEEVILRHLRGWEPCSLHAFARENGDEPALCGECGTNRGWIPQRGPHVRGCWVLDKLLVKE